MAKLTLTRVTSANQPNVINANYDAIEAFAELVLSRDGTVPNTMEANLDFNGRKGINVGAPVAVTDVALKQTVDDAVLGAIEPTLVDHNQLLNAVGLANDHAAIDAHITAQLALNATNAAHIADTSIHFADAPADSNNYVRNNNAWVISSAANPFVINSSIVGSSPPASGNLHDAMLRFNNSDNTETLFELGFDGTSSVLQFRNRINAALVEFRGRPATGLDHLFMSWDTAARIVTLYYNDQPTFIGRTTNDGWNVRAPSGGNVRLNFQDSGGSDQGFVGVQSSALRLSSVTHGQRVLLFGENTSGTGINLVDCDPDADILFGLPPRLPSYTVAGVPSATNVGQLAYISDETGGATIAFTDGTNWRRVQDRAIIA